MRSACARPAVALRPNQHQGTICDGGDDHTRQADGKVVKCGGSNGAVWRPVNKRVFLQPRAPRAAAIAAERRVRLILYNADAGGRLHCSGAVVVEGGGRENTGGRLTQRRWRSGESGGGGVRGPSVSGVCDAHAHTHTPDTNYRFRGRGLGFTVRTRRGKTGQSPTTARTRHTTRNRPT